MCPIYLASSFPEICHYLNSEASTSLSHLANAGWGLEASGQAVKICRQKQGFIFSPSFYRNLIKKSILMDSSAVVKYKDVLHSMIGYKAGIL